MMSQLYSDVIQMEIEMIDNLLDEERKEKCERNVQDESGQLIGWEDPTKIADVCKRLWKSDVSVEIYKWGSSPFEYFEERGCVEFIALSLDKDNIVDYLLDDRKIVEHYRLFLGGEHVLSVYIQRHN